MLRIMLLNPKGGCGKTTIATTLASYYAACGLRTALEDHDSQGSSTRWLNARPADLSSIHGVAAFRAARAVTRTWQMRLPADVERVVVDTAAGLDLTQVPELVRRADLIVVPVLPSRIDMDAAQDFLELLARAPAVRQGPRRVAVAAHRERRCSSVKYGPKNSLWLPSRALLVARSATLGLGLVISRHFLTRAIQAWLRQVTFYLREIPGRLHHR